MVGCYPGDGRSSQRSFTIHGDAEFAEWQRRELVDRWGVTLVGVALERRGCSRPKWHPVS